MVLYEMLQERGRKIHPRDEHGTHLFDELIQALRQYAEEQGLQAPQLSAEQEQDFLQQYVKRTKADTSFRELAKKYPELKREMQANQKAAVAFAEGLLRDHRALLH